MDYFKDILKGAVIGVANIIPGVSGGTMALVLGIYERLIDAIHNISLNTITATLGLVRLNKPAFARFKEEMIRIDALYLIRIATGALAAIVALAKLMTYLLQTWHDPTYGFFFGLVLVSALVPLKLIKQKNVLIAVIACIAAAGIVTLSHSLSGEKMVEKARVKHELQERGLPAEIMELNPPDQTSGMVLKMVHVFAMGAVAISAMILPGISGSFLLILMGGYFDILRAIASRDLAVLGIFALGCLAGMILFSRFLDYLLHRWHDQTMAFLLGLVLGSLWIIWPFKSSVTVGGETVYLNNAIPASFAASELYTIVTFAAGACIVIFLLWIEKRAGHHRE